MEQRPEGGQVRAGYPGHGLVLPDAESQQRHHDDGAGGSGGYPAADRPAAEPGQQDGDPVGREDQQGNLIEVAAEGDQGRVEDPAPRRGLAGCGCGPGCGLGFERGQQCQRRGQHAGEHERVRAGSLRVEADTRGQGHDQAREQSGPGRPGQPPPQHRDHDDGSDRCQHRRNPQRRRAAADDHPAVHQQVVQPVHSVDVVQQVHELAKTEQGGPFGGDLVVAHRRPARQPPQSEDGHDHCRNDNRPVSGRGPAGRGRRLPPPAAVSAVIQVRRSRGRPQSPPGGQARSRSPDPRRAQWPARLPRRQAPRVPRPAGRALPASGARARLSSRPVRPGDHRRLEGLAPPLRRVEVSRGSPVVGCQPSPVPPQPAVGDHAAPPE